VRAVSLQASDFQRALGSRPVSRTAHFVLHVLPVASPKLSTGPAPAATEAVDDCIPCPPPADLADAVAWSLGLVLPKKQARRSVTRSLIRHQVREALRRHGPAVATSTPWSVAEVSGWVVRLRSPFDRQTYPSAASDALKAVVRQEMDELWARVARGGWRLPEPAAPRPPREPRR